MSERCGATIEKEWPGHKAVLSRRKCRAFPLRGFAHCRHHLTLAEREQAAPPPESEEGGER